MRRLFSLLGAAALAGTTFLAAPALAQEPETPLLGGKFYSQTSGQPGLGFAVVDDSAAAMYSAYLAFGGPDYLGYPISRRFLSGGAVTQVFQRAALQVTPVGIRPLALLDIMSNAGLDGWLARTYQVPPSDPLVDPLAALEQSPTLKDAYYWFGPDLNGLPTAYPQVLGNVRTLRTQRSAIQESLSDGSITYLAVGEVAREAGIFPATAFQPQTRAQAASGSGTTTPATAPAAGGLPTTPPPLYVAASLETASPASGQATRVTVRVTDPTGQPVAGARVLVIVHYPLKPTLDEAYTIDGIFFGPETDRRGFSVVDIQLDPAVPPGVSCVLDISAIYPPAIGKTAVDFVLS
jgi:hypothetical protein